MHKKGEERCCLSAVVVLQIGMISDESESSRFPAGRERENE
jgi:hypothetical protein